MPILRARLLGGLSLAWDESVLPPIPGTASRSLFAYLVTYRHPHTRDLLAGTFWPDLPESTARRRLSHALWQIRKALAPRPVLKTEGDNVQLNPDLALWLDVQAFEACIEAHQAQPDNAREVQRAIDLYQGDFLDGYYEDWLLVKRERLREHYIAMLESLLALCKRAGDYEQALRHARQLAREEPWHEQAHREVMRLYHLLGRDGDALKHYATCRELLARELDTEPAPETTALATNIAERSDVESAPLLPTAAQSSPALLLDQPDQLPLIGRDAELGKLIHHVEQAAQGHGGMSLVYGPAGIGKTRLLQALARNATWRGVQSVWGRGYELSTPPAYQALIEVLRTKARVLDEVLVHPLWRTELSRWLPTLTTGNASPTLTPEESRGRLLEAIARALSALSRTAPHLVLLEDAHWMDLASLEALRYLLPRLPDQPLHLVLSIRPEDLDTTHTRVLSTLENTRIPCGIHLKGLDQQATANLTQTILALEKPAPLFSARLYTETEGNPFYLIETLRTLVDEGLLVRDAKGIWSTPYDEAATGYTELPLPPSVTQSITRRLDRLPTALDEVLSLAAVIGRTIPFDVWLRASGHTEPALLDAADTLCNKSLLVSGKTDYAFVHDQIRRVTYGRIAAPRRRFYHRRVAEALSEQQPKRVEMLAYHWTASQTWDEAAVWHRQAGDRARAVYANPKALDHYTQALQALAYLPDSQTAQFDVLLAREEVSNLQGDRTTQAEDLKTLTELSKQLGNSQQEIEVALRQARYTQNVGDFITASMSAQRAIDLAQAAHDIHREASGYLEWGSALVHQGNYEAARARLAQALTLTQQASLSALKADCLRNLGIGAYRFGDRVQAKAYFEQALTIYRETGDRRGESAALNNLGVFASDQGDFEEAAYYYHQSLHICREIGRRKGEANALNNLGLAAQRQEDYARARAYYEQSLPIYREIGDRWGESLTLGNLGLAAQDQGDYVSARGYNERSLHICREIGNRPAESNALHNLGMISYYLGQYAQARGYTEQSLEVCRDIGDRRSEAWGLNSLGLLHHRLDDNQQAQTYCEQALQIAREIDDHRLQGYALTILGDVLASLNDWKHASRMYQQAIDLRQQLGQSNRAIESLAGLALVHLAQKEEAQAQADVAKILQYLEDDPLDQADEPLRVYLACYRVLHARHDKRAGQVLQAAYTLLQERAEKITDVGLQRSFLENVAIHRDIISIFEKQHSQHQQRCVILARADAPTGRPLSDEEHIPVTWTITAPEDDTLPDGPSRRRHQLLRLLSEAAAQSAAPTVVDLADILNVSARTIKRDLAALRAAGHVVQTRGSAGPT